MPLLAGADVGLLLAAFGGGLLAMLLGTLLFYLEVALRWLLRAYPGWRPHWAASRKRRAMEIHRSSNSDGGTGCRPRSPASAYMYSTGAAIDKQQLSGAGSAEPTHFGDASACSTTPRALMPMRRQPRRASLVSDPNPEAAGSPHDLRQYQHPRIAPDRGRLAARSPTPPPGVDSGTGRQGDDRAGSAADPVGSSPVHAVLHSGVAAGIPLGPNRARGPTSGSHQAAISSPPAPHEHPIELYGLQQNFDPVENGHDKCRPADQQPWQSGLARQGAKSAGTPESAIATGGRCMRGRRWRVASSEDPQLPKDDDGGSSASEPIAATQRHSFPGWGPGLAFLTRDHVVGAWAPDCAQEHLHQGPLQQQQQMDRAPKLTAPELYGRLVAAISEVSSEGRAVHGRAGAAGAANTGSICSGEARAVAATGSQEDSDVAASVKPSKQDEEPLGFQEPSVRCAESGGKVTETPPARVVVPEGFGTLTLAAADEPVAEAVAQPEIWPDVDLGPDKKPPPPPSPPPPPPPQQQQQHQPAAAVSLPAPEAVLSAPWRISDPYQELASVTSGGTGAGATRARARQGSGSRRAGAAFTTRRLSLDMSLPASTFAGGTSTDIDSPAAPTSVLYGSPLRHVSVSMKLATPPGVQYSELEAAFMATAHRNIQAVLNSRHSGRSGNVAAGGGVIEGGGHTPGGSQGNSGMAGGEGEGEGGDDGGSLSVDIVSGSAAAGGSAASDGSSGSAAGGDGGGTGHHVRWRGYSAQVQCLPGCIQLILRVQYESDVELDEVAVAADLGVLQQGLLRQLRTGSGAAGSVGAPGRDDSGPSTSGPISSPVQDYPVFWVPGNPAAAPCTSGQLRMQAATSSGAGSVGQGPGARDAPAAPAAAAVRDAPGTRHMTRAVPVVVYMNPPVLHSAPATRSPSDSLRPADLLDLRTSRLDGSGVSVASRNLASDGGPSGMGPPNSGGGGGSWLGRVGKFASHTHQPAGQNSTECSTALPSSPHQRRKSHNSIGTSTGARAVGILVRERSGSWTVSQPNQGNNMPAGGHSSASEALWSPFRSPLTMSLRQSSEIPVELDAAVPSSFPFRAPPLSVVLTESAAAAAASSQSWHGSGYGVSGAIGAGNNGSAAAAEKAEGTGGGDAARSSRRRHVSRALTWDVLDARYFKDRCVVASAVSAPVSDRPTSRWLREMQRGDSFHTVGDSASDLAVAVADLTARQQDVEQQHHHHYHHHHHHQQDEADAPEHQERERCQQEERQQQGHGFKVLEQRLDEPVAGGRVSRCTNVGDHNIRSVSDGGESGLDCTRASPFVELAGFARAVDEDSGAGFCGASRSPNAIMPPAPLVATAAGIVVDRFAALHPRRHTHHPPVSAPCMPPNTPQQYLPQSLAPSPRSSAQPAPGAAFSRGITPHAHHLEPPRPVQSQGSPPHGLGSQCAVTRIVHMDILLDESNDWEVPHDAAVVAAGGSGGARDAATGLQMPVRSSVDVRVVVKQHGSVVAEVERLTVGRTGASVRLDLSGLEEGSAAVLVLPCRSQPAQPHALPSAEGLIDAEGLIGSEGREATEMKIMADAALSYIPIAVVPPAVASELWDLMREMEDEAEAAIAAVSYCPSNDPRVVRARAFTHHFSALISDIVSLLLGCERLAEEVEQQVVTGKKYDRECAAEEETNLAELQKLGAGVVSYLTQMGLRRTIQYLLEEITAAGVQVRGDELDVEEAVQKLLTTAEGLNGTAAAAPAVQDIADKRGPTHQPTTQGLLGIYGRDELYTPVVYESRTGDSPRHASQSKPSTCTAGETSSGGEGDCAKRSVHTSPGVGVLAPAAPSWTSVFCGFDPPMEARFEGYLYEQTSTISRAMMAAATAITAAVTFRCFGPQHCEMPLPAWSSITRFRTDELRGGRGGSGTAAAPARIAGGGGNGTVCVCGCGDGDDEGDGAVAPRCWASGGLQAGVLWLCWACGLSVALPAVVFGLITWLRHDVAFSGLRRREILVLCIHVAAMALLCAYGRCTADATGAAPLVLSLAAALLVVLQPASCNVRFRSCHIWWVLDAVLLWTMVGPLGSSLSSTVPGSWAVLRTFAAIGSFLAVSMVVAAATDLSQRRRFLQAAQRAV